jgi:hypothetical protein
MQIPLVEVIVGSNKSRNRMIFWCVLIDLCMVIYMLILGGVGVDWWYYGLEFIGGWTPYVAVVWMVARQGNIYTSNKHFSEYFLFANLVMAVIAFLYTFLLIPFYREAPYYEKVIIRLVVHPFLMECGLTIWRYCSLHFGTSNDQKAHYDILIIQITNAVYGRMFIVSIRRLDEAIALLVVSVVMDLLSKSTFRLRDIYINKAIKFLTGGRYHAKSKRLFERNLVVKANMAQVETYVELSVILFSPFLFWTFAKRRLEFDFIYRASSEEQGLVDPLINSLLSLAFEGTGQTLGLILFVAQGLPVLQSPHFKSLNITKHQQDILIRFFVGFCCFTLFIYIYRTWPFFVICSSNDGCSCSFPQHRARCN